MSRIERIDNDSSIRNSPRRTIDKPLTQATTKSRMSEMTKDYLDTIAIHRVSQKRMGTNGAIAFRFSRPISFFFLFL